MGLSRAWKFLAHEKGSETVCGVNRVNTVATRCAALKLLGDEMCTQEQHGGQLGQGAHASVKERDAIWSRGTLEGFPGHRAARSGCGSRLSCSREGRCYHHHTDETLEVQEKEVMDSGGSGGPCPCSGRLSHVVHTLQPTSHLASKAQASQGAQA